MLRQTLEAEILREADGLLGAHWWMTGGDQDVVLSALYVQEMAVIGYLEGFQMSTVTTAGLSPERDFRPWLRPASEHWWIRINRFWAGDHQALRETPHRERREACGWPTG